MQTLYRFLKDETGATAIEYGLIAALVSVVIIGCRLQLLGADELTTTFDRSAPASKIRHACS